jgi:hypothetical protein
VAAGRFLVDHVEPVLLQGRHGGLGGFDQEILFAGAEPDQFQALLELGVVQGFTLLVFPGRSSASSGVLITRQKT